jgi:ribosome-associated translation inhibitor RaiA
MTRPVHITFRNMVVSPALEQEIRSRAAWLETFHPGIVGCRVLLEIPHRHRQRGRPVHVRIELSLPGEDVIVNHEPPLDATARPRKSEELDGRHKDALVALHEAFDVARRRVEDVVRRQRGDVGSASQPTP